MDDLIWTTPKLVKTRYGEKLLKKAVPTPSFWDYWRSDKKNLKEQGYSVTKDEEGNWEVLHWGEIEGKEEQLEASKAEHSDFDVPLPEGLSLYPYQRAGIEYIVQRDNTFLADSMGLGKTVQAIGAINWWNKHEEPIQKVLIVCPNSLKYNWKKELEKWLTHKYVIDIVERQNYPEKYDILIINYDVLDKHKDKLKKEQWDLIVADESHYIKNKQAKRTKALIGARKNSGIKSRKKIFMTGTPITSKPSDLYTVLSHLDPERWTSWWSFVHRYEGAYQGPFGVEFSGPQNLAELQDILRSSIMIRRLKEDVLKDLPEKSRQIIPLSPDKEVKELLRQENEVLYVKSLADQGAVTGEGIEGGVGVLSLLRKKIAMKKLPYVKELINDALDSESKVIVFAHHKDVVKELYKEYSDMAVYITGDVGAEDRQNAVDKFQNDNRVRVFIGNIKAAGVGITLTASSHVIFAEISWVPSDLMQAEDRSLRIGQENNVTVQYPLYEDSVDINMMRAVIKKQATSDSALDNDYVLPEIIHTIQDSKPSTPTKSFTDEEKADLHEKIRYLAFLDGDRAQQQNNMGFSKPDSAMGHSLAESLFLSDRQAMIAEKLVKKYRRQLS